MPDTHLISRKRLTVKKVEAILKSGKKILLSDAAKKNVKDCRTFLDEKIDKSDNLFYGINTGFGSLCNINISKKEIKQLQVNLVKSHAAGTGDEVPPEIVKIILFLKIQNLSYGFSGIQLNTITRLIDFYNNNILPVIYQQGSLGASGDLAPLAHLSLPLLGLGEVHFKGRKYKSQEVLHKFDFSPFNLKSKEGLALLNGTQFSTAYGVWALIEAKRLSKLSDIIASISIDAFDCSLSPFDERLHKIRSHKGQMETASNITKYLTGSEIAENGKENIQDPYAFRCVPQVHGASKDTINYVQKVIETEINSVTDNPIIFSDDDDIVSGGNFHAQPIALAMDFLGIALSELGSISERRVFQLLSGTRGLPAFLTPKPGLNSGLMIAQYTAASIASQNKQLCTPASVDSITSSNGQEDHVSMAANAATKTYKIVNNLERLLAIEFMTAVQALEFRRPAKSSIPLEGIITKYRKIVPMLKKDRVLSYDIRSTVEFLKNVL